MFVRRISRLVPRANIVWHEKKRFYSNNSGWIAREAKLWVGAGIALAGGMFIYQKFYIEPVPLEIRKLIDSAKTFSKQGRYDMAIKSYNRAISILSASPLKEASLGMVYFELARCLEAAGKFEDADVAHSNVVHLWQSEKSDRFRFQVAASFEYLAQRAQEEKQYPKALYNYTQSLECLCDPSVIEQAWQRFQNPASPIPESVPRLVAYNVAGVLNNISTLYLDLGNPDKALAVLYRALAVMEILLMTTSPNEDHVRVSREQLLTSIRAIQEAQSNSNVHETNNTPNSQ